MAIPSRVAGPQISGATDMEVPPSSRTGGMMSLHAAARAAAPGHLVLYRVGEFYEVLGPDAAIVSRTLGIQLTRRRQKDAADIPMCGVPASTLETATARLLAAGHKVALSEQATEDGGDRPLRRLTPSTSVDAAVLAADRANNLTVVFAEGVAVAFAGIDLSTGEAGTCMAALEGCGPALARIAPSEVLVAQWPDGSDALAVALRGAGGSFSDLNRAELSSQDAQALLTQGLRSRGWCRPSRLLATGTARADALARLCARDGRAASGGAFAAAARADRRHDGNRCAHPARPRGALRRIGTGRRSFISAGSDCDPAGSPASGPPVARAPDQS